MRDESTEGSTITQLVVRTFGREPDRLTERTPVMNTGFPVGYICSFKAQKLMGGFGEGRVTRTKIDATLMAWLVLHSVKRMSGETDADRSFRKNWRNGAG
jgi:hypothetical protein